ncbi:MAG: hypothetical protein ACPHRO_10180 [Nannocystaceae bacterium]
MTKHNKHNHQRYYTAALSMCWAIAAFGCDAEENETQDDSLEIVGTYADEYDQVYEIGDSAWTISSMDYVSQFDYVTIDNDNAFIIAQNSLENDFSGGLFSRLDWTFDAEGSLYVCQCAYDAMTPEIAMDCVSDADDLLMGCGGFSWSLLTPQ